MSGQKQHPFDVWLASRLAVSLGKEERREYEAPIPLDSPDSPALGLPTGKRPDFLIRADDGSCVLLEHTRLMRNDRGRQEAKKARILEAMDEAGVTSLTGGYLILQDPNYRVPSKRLRRKSVTAQAAWMRLVASLRELSHRAAGHEQAESEGPPTLVYLRFPFMGRRLKVSFWDMRDRTMSDLVGSVAIEAELKFAGASGALTPRRSILVCISAAIGDSRFDAHETLRELHAKQPFACMTDACLVELLGERADFHWFWPPRISRLWLKLTLAEQEMAGSYLELTD